MDLISSRPRRLSQLESPIAIAMWDYSWLLRHHLGEFANFDRALDELADRGYNAVRIEAFPHFIAAGRDGRIIDSFFNPKRGWTCATWGAAYSGWISPRRALPEFLIKCRARGIRVGLSTWFQGHGDDQRNLQFDGIEGFVRAWQETLEFLEVQGLLSDILYVDLLNEFPLWHEYTWFKNEIKKLADAGFSGTSKLDSNMWDVGEPYNESQRRFYNDFIRDVIVRISARWPALDLFASFSFNENVPWQGTDLTGFSGLDVHVWMIHHPSCFPTTGYLQDMHPLKNDTRFAECQKAMLRWWKSERHDVISWMDGQLRVIAEVGRRHNLPTGNTEGWGPINWTEHPALSWDFTKEAGEICVDLAIKHGQTFICTSNFTHPQFKTLWDDLSWHRSLTAQIRKSRSANGSGKTLNNETNPEL